MKTEVPDKCVPGPRPEAYFSWTGPQKRPLGASGASRGSRELMARRSSSDGAVMAYLAKAVESRVTPEGAEIL